MTISAAAKRLSGGVFLLIVCASLVYRSFDSIWSNTIDISLHYALVARLSEHWRLVTNDDPSLEEMNTYPRYAHRLGALVGKLAGSPLAGMQIVSLASLCAIWASIAVVFLSLRGRRLLVVSCLLPLLLLANRFIFRLELFGSELVGNFFYPQLVAQALVMALIAAVLWLERFRAPVAVSYVLLAISVPILQQVHLLPAVEMMGVLALLVFLNVLDGRIQGRRNLFLFGLLCIALSLFLTLHSPAFRTMVVNAGNGVMRLLYTPTVGALAVECVIVAAVSSLVLVLWLRFTSPEVQNEQLAYKYMGLFGAAVSLLCLLQIILFKAGYGSFYACEKFAIGLNTALVLELVLLLALPLETFLASLALGSSPALARPIYPGIFVLFAITAIMPSPSARVMSVTEIMPAERFAIEHSIVDPASTSQKYDYAIGLFHADRVFEYLISIGDLKAPRGNNAFDLLFGLPLQKPGWVTRIFTRVGSQPWDIPECRQQVSADGFAILDGRCVLLRLGMLREKP